MDSVWNSLMVNQIYKHLKMAGMYNVWIVQSYDNNKKAGDISLNVNNISIWAYFKFINWRKQNYWIKNLQFLMNWKNSMNKSFIRIFITLQTLLTIERYPHEQETRWKDYFIPGRINFIFVSFFFFFDWG